MTTASLAAALRRARRGPRSRDRRRPSRRSSSSPASPSTGRCGARPYGRCATIDPGRTTARARHARRGRERRHVPRARGRDRAVPRRDRRRRHREPGPRRSLRLGDRSDVLRDEVSGTRHRQRRRRPRQQRILGPAASTRTAASQRRSSRRSGTSSSPACTPNVAARPVKRCCARRRGHVPTSCSATGRQCSHLRPQPRTPSPTQSRTCARGRRPRTRSCSARNPTPRRAGWMAEHFPEATVIALPNSGHFPHVAHPDAFARLLASVSS